MSSYRPASLVWSALLLLAAGIFVWAGFTKLLSPWSFARVLAFLLPHQLLGGHVLAVLAVLIGAFEVTLGASLVLTNRSSPYIVALAALGVFSLALIVLWQSPNSPSCGCLGGLRHRTGSADALTGLLRNGALATILVCLLVRHRARVPALNRQRTRAVAPGFTLIESLVTVVIVSVLLSLALPSLRKARERAVIAARTNTIQQLGSGLFLYSQDHRQSMPYFATPRDPLGPIRIRETELPPVYFKTQRWYWASVVVPDYVDVPRHAIEPRGRAEYLQDVLGYPDFIIVSSYVITSTAFASPKYWARVDESEWNRNEYYVATRFDDVVFPSQKGLIIADLTGSGGYTILDGIPVSMADGSARAPGLAEFVPERAVERPHGATAFPVVATEDGLAGRDF